MSTPEESARLDHHAAEARAREAAPAPQHAPEDHREHTSEVLASHGCVPSMEQQDVHNGAGLPAVDRGPEV